MKPGTETEPKWFDFFDYYGRTNNLTGRWGDITVHGDYLYIIDTRMNRLVVLDATGVTPEGKFVVEKKVLKELNQRGMVVFRYTGPDGEAGAEYPWNPNGSMEDIAGICDPTGRIFGLMPHPERHVEPTQHPRWTRDGLKAEGEGACIFRNAVEFARQNLL